MSRVRGTHILAVFQYLDDLLEAIRALKKEGRKEFLVISPVPHHDIEHELHPPKSPVRVYTLIGGLFGFTLGWVLTIGATNLYPLIVGGKPLVSIPPFGIIAYVLTILFGALATIFGLFVNTRLPQFKISDAYDERLSSDHFGIQVFCDDSEFDTIMKLLKKNGAIDFHRNVVSESDKSKTFID